MLLLNRLAPRGLTSTDSGHFLYSPHPPSFQNSILGDLRWLRSDNLLVVISLPFLLWLLLVLKSGLSWGSLSSVLRPISLACSFFPKIIPSTPEFYLFLSLINLFIVCACTCVSWYMCGGHRGPLVGIIPFLQRCRTRGFCSGYKAWQQSPLPTAPPHGPICLFVLQYWRLKLRLHT